MLNFNYRPNISYKKRRNGTETALATLECKVGYHTYAKIAPSLCTTLIVYEFLLISMECTPPCVIPVM